MPCFMQSFSGPFTVSFAPSEFLQSTMVQFLTRARLGRVLGPYFLPEVVQEKPI